jgi:hypothetical protein
MNLTQELIKCSTDIAMARSTVAPSVIAQPALTQLQNLIKTEVINKIDKLLIIQSGCGMGSFADVPWIVIRDKRASVNATSGYYISILFSKDGERVYIALATAAGASPTKALKKADLELIKKRAGELKEFSKQFFKSDYFSDRPVNLASDKPRPKAYSAGVAAYREYIVDELIRYDEDKFRYDLTNLAQGYVKIVNSGFSNIKPLEVFEKHRDKFTISNIYNFSSYCNKLLYEFN